MATLKQLKILLGILLVFFLLPLIVGQLPIVDQSKNLESTPQTKPVAYAETSNVTPSDSIQTLASTSLRSLILFTHTHEAYEPIVKNVHSKVAVSHTETNIFSLQRTIVKHFQLNGIATDVLGVDNMQVLKTQGKQYYQAYSSIRPFLKDKITKENYDLILDFHRDSAKHNTTTITHNGESYARIVFVVGTEHANYRWNLAKAETLSTTLNTLVPDISRGVMSKGGEGVDGKYNQDLSKALLIVELGGIDNNEEELNRTIAVLAKAISKSM